MVKECAWCKKEFEAHSKIHRFCCEKCQQLFYRAKRFEDAHAKKVIVKTCPVCGKDFEAKTSGQKYCSVKCKSLYWNHGGNVCKCTCKECGKEFEADYHSSYCSGKCRTAAKKKELAAEAMRKALAQPVKSLTDWSREADECNLDYGTYRALIAQGNSFETLKLRYADRLPITHSHISSGRKTS